MFELVKRAQGVHIWAMKKNYSVKHGTYSQFVVSADF